MTWHWRICFSACLAVRLGGATVSGAVELRDGANRANRAAPDRAGVVVWLAPASGGLRVAPAPGHVRMIQKNKTFTPHVLAIPVGTTVDFPNLDPIFHSAFSNYNGQIFDVGLYPPGSSRSITFARPGIVRVFCNIHAAMSAFIVVLDTPWFAVTGYDGRYSIAHVTPGEYTLHVFDERATATTLTGLERLVAVGAEDEALPPLAISESGFLPIPHKNKYGKDYPPPPDGERGYPAVRQ
jgi:plastocyanin